MATNYDLTNTGPEVQERLDLVFPNKTSIEAEQQARELADQNIKDYADGQILIEKERAEGAEATLASNIATILTGEVIVGELPATGEEGVRYRVPGTDSYSDYAWDGTQFVLLATYNIGIDNVPTQGSDNLVYSSGIYNATKDIPNIEATLDDVVELLSKSTLVDITDDEDGTIGSSYIGSNGRIYTSDSSYAVNYKYFAEQTVVKYTISQNSIGIVVSDTQPASTGTYTVVSASQGTGEYIVAAGKYLAWGLYNGTGSKIEIQSSELQDVVFAEDVSDTITEGDENPVSGGAVFDAIQDFGSAKETVLAEITNTYDGELTGYTISNNGLIFASTGAVIRYKQFSSNENIIYNVQGENKVIGKHSAIPQNRATITVIATSGNSGDATVESGKYLVWTKEGTNEICKAYKEEKIDIEIPDKRYLYNSAQRAQLKDTKSMLLCDNSLCLDWFKNSTKDIINVVSCTEDTITVSSADAEGFDSTTAEVAVKHSDGSYSIHLFSISSNVLTIIRRVGYDENADVSDGVKIQGAYDTNNSGMGQHLSGFGYLGLASHIYKEIQKRCSIKQDNFIDGFFFEDQGITTSYKSGLLYDTDGNVIMAPLYKNCTILGTSICGVVQDTVYQSIYDGIFKHYKFNQYTTGASVEFPFTGRILTKGYVEVSGATRSTGGKVRVDVLVNGVSVANKEMPHGAVGKLVFDNIDLGKNVSVKFTTLSDSTDLRLIYLALYECVDGKSAFPESISENTKIAIIGDSWTQFPLTTHPVESDNPYNTVDTLADGRTADGYCYMPKELSSLLGVTIDNYGKSNMTADFGIEQLASIISSGKHYDYIILEYYINDQTAYPSDVNVWLSRMYQLVKMCKSMNAVPIVLGTTATNSENQACALLKRNLKLLHGFKL